jgi:deazaflavin-dependent oxidoreductase (nitroreductase family)
MNALHRTVLKLSGNRVGARFNKLPLIELTTIGRKSGQARTVMLAAPIREGDTIVVVASRGGDDVHPAWFLNLRANPDVQVGVPGSARKSMRARVASSDERAELWPRITSDWAHFKGYQDKTQREIPLVLLEPC